jgi:hypothetical protein
MHQYNWHLFEELGKASILGFYGYLVSMATIQPNLSVKEAIDKRIIDDRKIDRESHMYSHTKKCVLKI